MSEWIERVHALADEQLTPEERQETLALLEQNPQAQAEYQWVLSLKDAMRCKCACVSNEEGWSACVSRLDALDRNRRTETFVGRYAWAMCAVFLVAILSAAYLNRTMGGRELSNEQVASLFGSFSPRMSAADAQAQRPAEVVNQCLDGGPTVLIPNDFRIRQVDHSQDVANPAARVILTDASGPLALILIKGVEGVEGVQPQGSSEFQIGEINNTPCVAWQSSGSTVLLIAPRPISELMQIAQSMRP